MDAEGARALAARLAETRPRPAPQPEPPEPSRRVLPRRNGRARTLLEPWLEAVEPDNAPAAGTPNVRVAIGSPPRRQTGERWLFHEQTHRMLMEGKPVVVTECTCTKLLPTGPETTVVWRRVQLSD